MLAALPSVSAIKKKSSIYSSLDQVRRMRDVRFGLVPFKHTIQEPNDETVRQQDDGAHQTRTMPKMPDLNWN